MKSVAEKDKTISRGNVLPKLTESQVSQQVIGFLQTKGWRAVRIQRGLANYGARGRVSYGEKGAADYLFTHPAAPAMYVEFKKPGEAIRESGEIVLALLKSRAKESKALRRELEQRDFLNARILEGYRACWTSSLTDFQRWYEGGR